MTFHDPKVVVELGMKVRDTISGFEGIATGKFFFLNGCVRVEITPQKIGKDGVPIEAMHFDEPQLQILEESLDKIKGGKAKGGPRHKGAYRHVYVRR